MPRRRRPPPPGSVDELVSETAALVERLLAERKLLLADNRRLQVEVDRLAAGWEQVRRLARAAPRRPRRRPGARG